MKWIHVSLLLLGLLAAGCSSTGFGHRDPSCNPDERLAQLMHSYEQCRSGRCRGNDGDHIVIDCGRAANEIERMALEFPRHPPILRANAAIALENRQVEKAQIYLDRLFHVSPVDPDAAVLRSQVAIREGNLPAARRLLEDQIRYTPNHYGLREAHAALLFLSANLDGAQRELDAAERLGAPAWRIAYHRGLLAEGRDQGDEAIRQYQVCLDANPDFGPAQSRLSGRNAERGVE